MKPTENSILKFIARGQSRSGLAQERTAGLRVGMGDDAAVWLPRAGYETILTCDWFLEGTHFLVDRHSPHSVGWKCLARALSDVAAMGGDPRCFLLNLALPGRRTKEWLASFLRGLRSASRDFHCPIAGGDTTQRDQVLINVTVIGECRRGQEILRSGARQGDAIYVTGRLGEAEYGLRLIQTRGKRLRARDPRLRKHLYPRPRLEAGAFLASRRLATAMMDLSDGLSSDLPKLCVASGVGARIAQEKLPCVRVTMPDLRDGLNTTQLALHGGDDYELLFTVAQKNIAQIPKKIGTATLTQIGQIISQQKILLTDQHGRSKLIKDRGWDPFR